MKRILILLLGCGLMASQTAQAGPITWTDWTAAECPGNAMGTMGGVTVSYSGSCAFAQTGTGTNYWTENGSPAPYTGSSVIDNAPTAAEMLGLNLSATHTITFSEAVLNPIMAIVSMGQPNLPVSYDFNTAFSLLSNGVGYWSFANGDAAGSAVIDSTNYILTGSEFHGAIQFSGLISSIQWTSNPNEFWHGITIGAPAAVSVPEPGTLALFGLGLLGAGLTRRNRRV